MRTLVLLSLLSICAPANAENYSCGYGAGGASRAFTVDANYAPVCTMSWTYIGYLGGMLKKDAA